MGIVVKDLDLIFRFIEEKKLNLKGLKMLELGNEWLQPNSWQRWADTSVFEESNFRYKQRNAPTPISDENGKETYLVSKFLFEHLGVEHISVDLNGQDGAVKVDLTKDFMEDGKQQWWNESQSDEGLKKYFEYFDVVTNCGTTEHVDNDKGHNNYIAWKNLHNFLKVDGLHFSSLPTIGYWPGHCNIYYNCDFFEKLCNFCNYELIYNQIIASPDQVIPETNKPEPNIRAAFIKKEDSKFLSEEEFSSFVRVVDRPFYAMGPNKLDM